MQCQLLIHRSLRPYYSQSNSQRSDPTPQIQNRSLPVIPVFSQSTPCFLFTLLLMVHSRRIPCPLSYLWNVSPTWRETVKLSGPYHPVAVLREWSQKQAI